MVIWVLEVILLPLDGIKMLIITNTDIQPTAKENVKIVKQWFADNNINITGKKLKITPDNLGRVSEIEVDAVLTPAQVNAFKLEFFDMSYNEVLGEIHSLSARADALERGRS